MKKSLNVPATLVATIAAGLMAGGCSSGPREVRRCVDEQGKVLPDGACTTATRGTSGSYHGYHYVGQPRYVYGGTGRGDPGSYISGYKSSPSDGAHVVDPNGKTIRRGGFGGSSSRYGGGWG